MLKSQKISIELSGVRSDLLDDELDSDKRNELVAKYQELESRHAAAIIAEGGDDDSNQTPAPRDLVSRVDVGEYAEAAAVENRALDRRGEGTGRRTRNLTTDRADYSVGRPSRRISKTARTPRFKRSRQLASKAPKHAALRQDCSSWQPR